MAGLGAVTTGVGFALLSLVCAGVADVVFGRYSARHPVTGGFLSLIGVVVLLGQSIAWAGFGPAFAWDARVAGFGIAAGAIVMLANALLIASLAGINVSLGSTVYRLNTIAVVLVAVLFLGEVLTWTRAAGIAFGVCAVVLLYHRAGKAEAGASARRFLCLAIVASLLRAAFGLLAKIALEPGVDPFVLLLFVGVGWSAAALAYAWLREGGLRLRAGAAGYALACGALISCVASFLILGLRHADATVVIPIANMSFVVALSIAAALGMESLSLRKLVAVALAGGALLLLARA